jgi:hypothetical protein
VELNGFGRGDWFAFGSSFGWPMAKPWLKDLEADGPG